MIHVPAFSLPSSTDVSILCFSARALERKEKSTRSEEQDKNFKETLTAINAHYDKTPGVRRPGTHA